METDPKEEVNSNEAEKNLDDFVEESGKKGWRFLRSVWFWVIAGPINLMIAALVIAWAFPYIFLSFPEPPPEVLKAKKAILIDKSRQGAYAYENGQLKHKFVILTGTADHDTPTGVFKATRKVKDYHSKKYDAPMPYSVFFIDSHGVAMHAAFFVGPQWCLKHWSFHNPYIGSHGCVRLTPIGAWQMYRFADIGTPVVIIAPRPMPTLPR